MNNIDRLQDEIIEEYGINTECDQCGASAEDSTRRCYECGEVSEFKDYHDVAIIFAKEEYDKNDDKNLYKFDDAVKYLENHLDWLSDDESFIEEMVDEDTETEESFNKLIASIDGNKRLANEKGIKGSIFNLNEDIEKFKKEKDDDKNYRAGGKYGD